MYKNLFGSATAAVLAFLLSLLHFNAALAQAPNTEPLKIGFVYVAPLTPAGWVRQHESGRQAVEKNLNLTGQLPAVQTSFVENVAEGADAERVIRDLARQGHKLIFTPSFGYMEPTLKVAQEFPDVKFESITGIKTAANVATANARYYEGRYLAGVAAGRVSQSGLAGYAAGFPIPEVLQGINAFTLGMRSVNPKAQVKVIWLNVWFDPAKEREAAVSLMNQGADVLAFHTGSSAVMAAAQERRKANERVGEKPVWAVAYHSDMRHVAPDAQLLAVTHHWGDYYTRRAQAVINGTWRSQQTMAGLREGMIRVGDYSAATPQSLQKEIATLQQHMVTGKLQPFTGPLVSNEGVTVLAKGQHLSDTQIAQMNYLVQGVQGSVR